MYIGLGLLALLVLGAIYAIAIRNRLVTLRNRYRNAWAQIDVQLKRRYDLIPNLVETAKAYMQHERATLEAVVAARGAAVSASQRAARDPGDPAAMRALGDAERSLAGSLARLLAVVESYPELKAAATMGQLMEELTSTENRIAYARQAFNDSVTEYNTEREKFPSSIIANSGGFRAATLLEIEAPAERQAPRVSFA